MATNEANNSKHDPFFGEIEEIYNTLNTDFTKGMLLLDIEKTKQHNNIYTGVTEGFRRKGSFTKKIAFNQPKNPKMKPQSRYFDCFDKDYTTLMKKIKDINNTWTVEEDSVLYEEVIKYLMDDKPIMWSKIEDEYFKGIRTRKELQSRWRHHLDPLITRIGEWSSDEIEVLLTALTEAFDQDMKKPYSHASVAFKGERSAIQCRNKWKSLIIHVAEKLKIQSSNVTPKMVLEIVKIGPLKIEYDKDKDQLKKNNQK